MVKRPMNDLDSQTQLPLIETSDAYLWLENIDSTEALNWVRAQNQTSEDQLGADPDFKVLQQSIETALNDTSNLPMPEGFAGMYYNFWRDRDHPRGIWRRTTPGSYAQTTPDWEVLLDLDQLAAQEGENWVWKQAIFCAANPDRALLFLSRGGADASVMREFDLQTHSFVPDGFQLPEDKHWAAWRDQDTLWVTHGLVPAEKTTSGYPHVTRSWKRGTPLQEAPVIHQGKTSDMGVWAGTLQTAGRTYHILEHRPEFFRSDTLLQWEGELRKLPKPEGAEVLFFQDQVVYWLRKDHVQQEQTFVAGSLIATPVKQAFQENPLFSLVFAPQQGLSLQQVALTRDSLVLGVLHHVVSELYTCALNCSEDKGSWTLKQLPAPAMSTIHLLPEDPNTSDAVLLLVTGFLTPTTLIRMTSDGQQTVLKANPMHFDPTGLTVEQHFATSKDGTRVPYFQVGPQNLKWDGNQPTLLYGYGGFERSMSPVHSTSVGKGWLAQGGVFVLANIRGGGEYGPAWHQAALKENRQRAFDDFIAVAQDLIERKLTSPARLGVKGGSNGGLLSSAMLVQRPDLFGAVVSEVPLTDMLRFHKLLAGASWMAEYGNPDTEDRHFLQKYSPYHNIQPVQEKQYPPALYMTSTRDDRVHPGHARKMAARLLEQGQQVLYYENTEGGHGGAANNSQSAHWQALNYTFLKQQLFD